MIQSWVGSLLLFGHLFRFSDVRRTLRARAALTRVVAWGAHDTGLMKIQIIIVVDTQKYTVLLPVVPYCTVLPVPYRVKEGQKKNKRDFISAQFVFCEYSAITKQ